jgi:hypothetical protein
MQIESCETWKLFVNSSENMVIQIPCLKNIVVILRHVVNRSQYTSYQNDNLYLPLLAQHPLLFPDISNNIHELPVIHVHKPEISFNKHKLQNAL